MVFVKLSDLILNRRPRRLEAARKYNHFRQSAFETRSRKNEHSVYCQGGGAFSLHGCAFTYVEAPQGPLTGILRGCPQQCTVDVCSWYGRFPYHLYFSNRDVTLPQTSEGRSQQLCAFKT